MSFLSSKAVPLQAWTGPEGSKKLRLPDFVITAQDVRRLLALRAGFLITVQMILEEKMNVEKRVRVLSVVGTTMLKRFWDTWVP